MRRSATSTWTLEFAAPDGTRRTEEKAQQLAGQPRIDDLDEPGLVWSTPQEFFNAFHPGDYCSCGSGCDQGDPAPERWHQLEGRREGDNYQDVLRSLQENGWVRPLVWFWRTFERRWGSTPVRQIHDGHTRIAAATELGMSLPTVELEQGGVRARGGLRGLEVRRRNSQLDA